MKSNSFSWSFIIIFFLILLGFLNSQDFSSGGKNVFLEPELALEDYEEFKLVPNVDFYISFVGGLFVNKEYDNFFAIKNELAQEKSTLNGATTVSTNQYNDHRNNSILPYTFGASLQIFIYKYWGIGFQYNRFQYFSHEKSIIKNDPEDSNHYIHTIGYNIYGYGNGYHFSFLTRAPFGPRKDNNIYLVFGLGYSFLDGTIEAKYQNKIDNTSRSEKFNGKGHGFHGMLEITTKIDWVNFSFGGMFLLGSLNFNGSSTTIDNFPNKINLTEFGPLLYGKIGFNF